MMLRVLKSLLLTALAGVAVGEGASARIAGYAPPPSDHEALLAIQSTIIERTSSGYFANPSNIASGANYPVDVQLFRCDKNPERILPPQVGFGHRVSGYECVATIYPMGAPAYKVGGFFFFDGSSWRYYGPLSEPDIVEIDKFEQSYEPSVLSPKDGAIRYRGFTGLAGDEHPYDGILGRVDE